MLGRRLTCLMWATVQGDDEHPFVGWLVDVSEGDKSRCSGDRLGSGGRIHAK